MQPTQNPTQHSAIVAEDFWSSLREKVYLGVQIIGVLLVIFGIFISIQVFWDIFSMLRDTNILAYKMKGFNTILANSEIFANTEEYRINSGNAIAMIMMFLWYCLLASIPLGIIRAGGYLASAGAADRRLVRALEKANLKNPQSR